MGADRRYTCTASPSDEISVEATRMRLQLVDFVRSFGEFPSWMSEFVAVFVGGPTCSRSFETFSTLTASGKVHGLQSLYSLNIKFISNIGVLSGACNSYSGKFICLPVQDTQKIRYGETNLAGFLRAPTLYCHEREA
jgi:hypothetical protein